MENSAEYQRLLHVILDQLHQAKLVSSYLPHSEHPALKQLLIISTNILRIKARLSNWHSG